MRYALMPMMAASLLLGACSSEQDVATVSFKTDVLPVLTENCLKCHGGPEAEGTLASGLRMDTYEGLMKGTKFGPVVDAGYPDTSVINQVVEGRVNKAIRMPHGPNDRALTPSEQKILRDWVAQGAQNN